ncbi:MAG: alpha/beta hydrolase [Winogradskyella sp.]|uniref:alpha/beta hydrolase n=1 Tax=Winogradskyella sp. TaxID=1883156 RepID=UPI00385A369C
MKTIKISLVYILSTLFFNSIQSQSQIIEEEILLKNDSVQLPGTLSYNKTLESQPLVIFIHGSGNVDRNGNQAGINAKANYIKQLSTLLNNENIAFYRYDKRTSTVSNMKFIMRELSFDKFVEDAKLTINNFKDDSRFSSITLIGHSQGSLVGMLSSVTGVDKYISLAGPSAAFDVIITKQIRLQNGDSIANIVESHFEELKTTGTIAKVDLNLMSMFNKPTQPFLVSWAAYNPSEEIKKVIVPTLIINGTKDLQVSVEDAKQLKQSKDDAELVIIENMNHVLKTIINDEDNLKSYNSPNFPLSEKLVSTITAFIKK